MPVTQPQQSAACALPLSPLPASSLWISLKMYIFKQIIKSCQSVHLRQLHCPNQPLCSASCPMGAKSRHCSVPGEVVGAPQGQRPHPALPRDHSGQSPRPWVLPGDLTHGGGGKPILAVHLTCAGAHTCATWTETDGHERQERARPPRPFINPFSWR